MRCAVIGGTEIEAKRELQYSQAARKFLRAERDAR